MSLLLTKASKLRVFDGFNRANDALTLGNADTGQAWTVPNGNYGILNNQAYLSSYADGGTVAYIDTELSDCLVECTVPSVDRDFMGLGFRFFGVGGLFRITRSNPNWKLFRREEGSVTELADLGVATDGDRLTVILRGSTIQAYVNGVIKATVTDSSGENSTLHGFCAFAGTGFGGFRWDNFRVEVI